MKKNNFIYFVESEIQNKNKNIFCNECNEADEKMFKIVRLTKTFLNELDRVTSYLCKFHCQLNFPYYFKNTVKKKNKNQLNFFEETL